MPFSTLGLSVATAGMATLAFAIAAPASAQEPYAHTHYAHTHYHPTITTIITTPTMAKVVRSSFIRKRRCRCSL